LVLVDLNNPYNVSDQKLFSKCGWSPLKNETFKSKVIHTIVSGNHMYNNGKINQEPNSMRLAFERD
jgi:dihydroorotase